MIKTALYSAGKAAGPVGMMITTVQAPSGGEHHLCSCVKQMPPFKNDCSTLNDIFVF